MARKAREVTIQEDGELAHVKGSRVDRFAPDPREIVPYSPELADYIIREIAKGGNLVDICAAEGMPHQATFLRWCQSMPELGECYGDAKRLRAHARAEQVEQITSALDPQTSEKTEAYVADIKARNLLRLAEIGDPQSFSPKMQMTHIQGGTINISLDLETPQSRQIIDTTATEAIETPSLASPSVGHEGEKVEGAGGQDDRVPQPVKRGG